MLGLDTGARSRLATLRDHARWFRGARDDGGSVPAYEEEVFCCIVSAVRLAQALRVRGANCVGTTS